MAGIAILGAGIFATEEHLPALVSHKANIKAIYSRSKATASTLVAEAKKLGVADVELYSEDSGAGHTLDDLLKRDDIKAVVIVLPILVQPDIIRRCLAAGKHVLSEKPLAKDVQTGRELIEDYKKNYADKGLILSIAEQFRFMHEFELGRKWVVDEKAIGDITQLHLRVWRNLQGGKYYETPWRKVPEYQGGFLLDGGVHQTAMLRYVSGQEVVETHGFARQVASHLPPLDTVNAGILLSGGGTGTISMSFAATKRAAEFIIHGTKGSFTLIDAPEGFTLSLDLFSGEKREETIKSDGVSLEIKAFLDAVEAGKAQHRAGPEEALNDLAIIESLCSGGGKVNLY